MKSKGLGEGPAAYHPQDVERLRDSAKRGVDAIRNLEPEAKQQLIDNLPGKEIPVARTVSALDGWLLERDASQLTAITERQAARQMGTTKLDEYTVTAHALGELRGLIEADGGAHDHLSASAIVESMVQMAQAANLSLSQFEGLMARLEIVAGLREAGTFRMTGMPIHRKLNAAAIGQQIATVAYAPLQAALRPPDD